MGTFILDCLLKVKRYIQYDDNELLYLLTQNDKAAFTELYNRYWQKLYAIAYNRLKETQTAEDIVHDVLVGLWVSRDKINIDLLENYLATATKYAVLGKFRKKERERRFQNSLQQTQVIELPIEDELHCKKILEVIKNEVEHLPERCRLIFKCSREEGKPVKQIARELKLSPKTVENQLTKAIKQLRLATKSLLHSFFSFLL